MMIEVGHLVRCLHIHSMKIWPMLCCETVVANPIIHLAMWRMPESLKDRAVIGVDDFFDLPGSVMSGAVHRLGSLLSRCDGASLVAWLC